MALQPVRSKVENWKRCMQGPQRPAGHHHAGMNSAMMNNGVEAVAQTAGRASLEASAASRRENPGGSVAETGVDFISIRVNVDQGHKGCGFVYAVEYVSLGFLRLGPRFKLDFCIFGDGFQRPLPRCVARFLAVPGARLSTSLCSDTAHTGAGALKPDDRSASFNRTTPPHSPPNTIISNLSTWVFLSEHAWL